MCKAASNHLSIRSNWNKSVGESSPTPNPNNVDADEVSDLSDVDGDNLKYGNVESGVPIMIRAMTKIASEHSEEMVIGFSSF